MCRGFCSQRLRPVLALGSTWVQDQTSVSARWAEATAATRFPENGPGRRSSLSVFFSVSRAKIKFHFHWTTQTKNKIEKSDLVLYHFSPWSGPIQVTGYALKSVMNSCLALPCLEFKAVSQPMPRVMAPQSRQGYLWKVRPRVKRESGQLFLEALAVGFRGLFFTIPESQ